ncbi:MAG: hypothetical protein K6E84_03855 [Lachnospiraceae bacterium]|nr:hypothetical protein [Lachnospiraceae bacterium]
MTVGLLSGCGQKDPEDVSYNIPSDSKDAGEKEPASEAGSQPSVSADTVAGSRIFTASCYGPEDVKTAVFKGNDLADYFRVVSVGDGKSVYEGRLEKSADANEGREEVRVGDFSEITQPGNYYIETPVIGRSTVFEIREDAAEETGAQLMSLWKQRFAGDAGSKENGAQAAKSLLVMGQSEEMLASAGSQEQDHRRLIDAALLLEGAEDGWDPQDDGMAEASYIAAMAQCSFLLSREKEYAEEFRKEALEAYQELTGANVVSQQAMLLSQAALYKLTQNPNYAADLQVYLKQIKSFSRENYDIAYFYLTTPKNVDMEICDELMKMLVRDCGNIIDEMPRRDGEIASLIAAGTEMPPETRDGELFFGVLLRLADHVLVSEEYRKNCSRIRSDLMMPRCVSLEELDSRELAELIWLSQEEKSPE